MLIRKSYFVFEKTIESFYLYTNFYSIVFLLTLLPDRNSPASKPTDIRVRFTSNIFNLSVWTTFRKSTYSRVAYVVSGASGPSITRRATTNSFVSSRRALLTTGRAPPLPGEPVRIFVISWRESRSKFSTAFPAPTLPPAVQFPPRRRIFHGRIRSRTRSKRATTFRRCYE